MNDMIVKEEHFKEIKYEHIEIIKYIDDEAHCNNKFCKGECMFSNSNINPEFLSLYENYYLRDMFKMVSKFFKIWQNKFYKKIVLSTKYGDLIIFGEIKDGYVEGLLQNEFGIYEEFIRRVRIDESIKIKE